MADHPRVLFINEGWLGTDVMGQLQAGSSLIERSAQAGLEVSSVSLPPMGVPARLATVGVPGLELLDADFHTVRWHLTQTLRARRVLRREIARARPDVVHVHGHTLGLMLGREMAQVPTLLALDATVWQWHEMGIWRDLRPWSHAFLSLSLALEQRAFAAAAHVLAYSDWVARDVRATQPQARVLDLHPGLDLDRYRPAPRRPHARPRVLFVGGRFTAKGGDDLLDAAAPMLGRELDLDIVTPAPVTPRDGVRVHRFGPNDPGLIDLYQQADLLCLPTRGDAAPWVLLEAMACGTPVLAFDVGAIAEIIGDGVAGVVLPKGDVVGLRDALRELAADPARRARLGAAGRARIEARYDGRAQASHLVALIRDLAAR